MKESRLKFVAQFENGSVGLQLSQKTILLQPGRKRQHRIVLYGPLCRSTLLIKGLVPVLRLPL
jgi:hypothetical protein